MIWKQYIKHNPLLNQEMTNTLFRELAEGLIKLEITWDILKKTI